MLEGLDWQLESYCAYHEYHGPASPKYHLIHKSLNSSLRGAGSGLVSLWGLARLKLLVQPQALKHELCRARST